MSPKYGKYIGQNEVREVELFLLPLCDGRHFYGYIIGLKKKNSVCIIHSMYQPKPGKRSIGAKLNETYFNADTDVTYYERVQVDGHGCGAWLIAGFVGCVSGIEKDENVLNRERVFNLMMILIEDLDMVAKKEKTIVVTQKRKTEQLEDNGDSDHLLTSQNVKGREKYIIYDNSVDCSDEEQEQVDDDHHDDLFNLNKSSTPRNTKNMLKTRFCYRIDGEDDFDFSYSDSGGFTVERIPYLSALSSDESCEENKSGESCNENESGESKNEAPPPPPPPPPPVHCITESAINGCTIKRFLSADVIIDILNDIIIDILNVIIDILNDVGDRRTVKTFFISFQKTITR